MLGCAEETEWLVATRPGLAYLERERERSLPSRSPSIRLSECLTNNYIDENRKMSRVEENRSLAS